MNILLSYICPVLEIIFLVMVVSFFASSETAFLSIQKVTVRQLLKSEPSNKKNTPAKKIAYLKDNMDTLLTLVLIGINFVTTLASSLATAFATDVAGNKGASYATFIMSFILIIFGEIVPKTIAGAKTVQVAKFEAGPLIFLQKILFPFVCFFTMIAVAISKIIGNIFPDNQQIITEEELKTLIDVGSNEGTLEQNERTMLYKIFAFSDLHVHDILRHRSLVRGIEISSSYKELVKQFTTTGYSRLPVYEEDMEHIVAVISYKAVIFAPKDAKESENFIKENMKAVLFVPESLTALELLQKFKKENSSFAVALNEQGAFEGIVTMDDILRAVMGRASGDASINDMAPEQRIQIVSPNEFIVPGDLRLSDVNEILKLNLDSEIYDTLGGWLLEKFDALPSVGEMLKNDNVVFMIEDQSQRRIQSVRVKLA